MSEALAAAYEWMYLPLGKVSHALPAGESRFSAECGTYTWNYWYGTGNQIEYNKAAALPRCAKCLKRVGASAKGRRKPRGIR